MAVVSINYEEGNKADLNYKSVKIKFALLKNEKTFNSGNFVKDWYDLNKFIIHGNLGEPISHSSSVNHFIMDGAPYDSAYLHIKDELPILDYERYGDSLMEFFVSKGTRPTWEELRELCGDKKTNTL